MILSRQLCLREWINIIAMRVAHYYESELVKKLGQPLCALYLSHVCSFALPLLPGMMLYDDDSCLMLVPGYWLSKPPKLRKMNFFSLYINHSIVVYYSSMEGRKEDISGNEYYWKVSCSGWHRIFYKDQMKTGMVN
jgi:hypothetical protein